MLISQYYLGFREFQFSADFLKRIMTDNRGSTVFVLVCVVRWRNLQLIYITSWTPPIDLYQHLIKNQFGIHDRKCLIYINRCGGMKKNISVHSVHRTTPSSVLSHWSRD